MLEGRHLAEGVEREEGVLPLRPLQDVDLPQSTLDLREELAMLGDAVREGADPEAIVAWSESRVLRTGRVVRLSALALAAVNVATLGYWLLASGSVVPFGAAVVASFAFSRAPKR